MAKRIAWNRITDEQLLNLRFRDLPLELEGTPVARRVKHLYSEMEMRGIRCRPHVWLSEEFFTPDGVPGFAIPFYLAHPRLMKLERRQMLEVEGGTDRWCMRILRHEAGHALDNAYRLHFKRSWQDTFGSFARPYPQAYKPKPKSRNYVLHLDAWYAQAHPAEDYAETFAVWLPAGGRWRTRYKGWPALRKIEYMDRLMKEISRTRPKNRVRTKVDSLSQINITLREHYRRKRELYSLEFSGSYDRDLRRIFSEESRYASRPTATAFLRRYRPELRQIVADGTGVHRYTVDHVLKNIIERARELKLHVSVPERLTKRQAMIMLTVHTMNIVHSGYYRFQYGL